MVKYISMLMLAFCLCTNKSYAAGPSIGLIVPYKVECVKQNDGTEQIRMSVLLRTATKALTVDGTVQTTIDGVNNPTTHILQSKDGCEVLDALFTNTGKLYGHEAIQVGLDLENVLFTPGTSAPGNESGTLCAYLMRLELCCGQSAFDALKDIALIDGDNDVQWVDLGTVTSNSSSALSAAPYGTDAFLTTIAFLTGTGPSIRVNQKIASTAILNLHGKVCCFGTFGLTDEAAQGGLMQIIAGLETTPGTFTAMGTWGSCGDTAKVKVTGNKTSQVRIDICGKTFCLLEGLSVAAGNEPIGIVQSTTPNQSTARCFTKFLGDYIAFGNPISPANGYAFTPPFGTHGLQFEICRLVQGVDVVLNGVSPQEERFQLRLVCIDQETGTYEFAITREIDTGTLTFIRMLGCRFRLVECSKCCK